MDTVEKGIQKCPLCELFTKKKHCKSPRCIWFICEHCSGKSTAVVFRKTNYFIWRVDAT